MKYDISKYASQRSIRIQLFGKGWLNHCNTTRAALPAVFWPLIGLVATAADQRISRTRLAGELWPDNDEASARHCLASALWRIRNALPSGAMLLTASGDWIALARGHRLWVDTVAFDIRLKRALAAPERLSQGAERQRLAQALGLYRNAFLRECDHPWAGLQRERLRTLYLDGLYELAMAECQAGNWGAAQHYARAVCAEEPLREDAHRLLMTAYARCGNRAMALQQYRRCQSVLADDLGVAPMPETSALFEEIAHRQGRPDAMPGNHSDLVRIRQELAGVLARIDERISRASPPPQSSL